MMHIKCYIHTYIYTKICRKVNKFRNIPILHICMQIYILLCVKYIADNLKKKKKNASEGKAGT